MSLPRVLCVDDSDAILAYEQAALAGHYVISTASDGEEGLVRAREVKPELILLDLSMPRLSGDEMLERLKADPALADIPVIVVSSEEERGRACLKRGAHAFIPKPLRADELRARVTKVLDEVREARRRAQLAFLFVRVSEREFAVPLDCVRTVALHPMPRRVETAPSYVVEVVEAQGAFVPLLDFARPLRLRYAQPLVERKLVILEIEGRRVALSVDSIGDPEEFLADAVTPRSEVAGLDDRLVAGLLRGIVRTARGPVPVLEPKALLTRDALRRLAAVTAPLPAADASGARAAPAEAK